MEGQVEAVGGLVTETAAARALEPPAARPNRPMPADPAVQDSRCRNCNAVTSGTFCANCGQATHIHRSLSHAVEELVHGVLHFDSKLWRTLPMLVWRPGQLTRDYVMGRRVRYISPFALFLLTIFTMVFLFSVSGGLIASDADVAMKIDAGTGRAEAVTSMAAMDLAIAELDRDIAAAGGDPARASELAAMKATRAGVAAGRDIARAQQAAGKTADGTPAWAAMIKSANESGELSVDLPNPSLTQKVRKALQNPELTAYKMQQKGYKLSFLLLPLSLPWMLLLFAARRDVRAYDHVVFLLYSISFMTLLVICAALLSMAGLIATWMFVLLFNLVPPLHMFVHVRDAYALTTASALWRTMLLVLLAFLTIIIYAGLILVLGVVN